MSKACLKDVRDLEEKLVTEVRVSAAIFDMDLHDYAEWSASHIQPLEYAQAHAVGWLQGRSRAAAGIAGLLRELRMATGDDERAWTERLARLGITRERLVSAF